MVNRNSSFFLHPFILCIFKPFQFATWCSTKNDFSHSTKCIFKLQLNAHTYINPTLNAFVCKFFLSFILWMSFSCFVGEWAGICPWIMLKSFFSPLPFIEMKKCKKFLISNFSIYSFICKLSIPLFLHLRKIAQLFRYHRAKKWPKENKRCSKLRTISCNILLLFPGKWPVYRATYSVVCPFHLIYFCWSEWNNYSGRCHLQPFILESKRIRKCLLRRIQYCFCTRWLEPRHNGKQ